MGKLDIATELDSDKKVVLCVDLKGPDNINDNVHKAAQYNADECQT
jgi:hypothetical protein